MAQTVKGYLSQTERQLSKPAAEPFGLTAVILLKTTQAYVDRDWDGLKEFAEDMIEENRGTIRAVRKHPDVFHPHVARSREDENRIYQQVITLIDQP